MNTEKISIDKYFPYYEYISSRCKNGQYNIFLHRHLGDSIVLLALKKQFEEKYQKPIHYLIQSNQEILAWMYEIDNYTIVDFKSFMDEPGITMEYSPFQLDKYKENLCERLFPSVPQLDKPFIAAPASWIKDNCGWENFVDGWAKMIGLEAKKILPPSRYPKLSTEMEKKISNIGTMDEIVLIAPEAQSFQKIEKVFWDKLVRRLKKEGKKIIVNAINEENYLDGTNNLKMSLSDLLALGYSCQAVYSYRSGLCDCLVNCKGELNVYYSKEMWYKYLSLNECFILDRTINEMVVSTVGNEVARSAKFLKKNLKQLFQKKKKLLTYIPISNSSTIESKDISVVIQGAVSEKNTKKCVDSVRRLLPDAEIILSTWQGSDITNLDYDILVLNKDPGSRYFDISGKIHNNNNRQIISTGAGIRKATRKYILKFRTDFKLDSIEFLKYWNEYPMRKREYAIFEHRVLTDVLFSRFRSDETGRPTPFHISDLWMFGYAKDLKEYFCDIPLLSYSELGNYSCLYPAKIPYNSMTFRYAPEQYFGYHFAKKNFESINFDDWTDWDEKNILISDNIIYNNFIFLSFEQSGIWSDKHAHTILKENYINGIINHFYFQVQYKNYCDKEYEPRKLYVTDGNLIYITLYEVLYNLYRLFKSVLSFFKKIVLCIRYATLEILEKLLFCIMNKKIIKRLR